MQTGEFSQERHDCNKAFLCLNHYFISFPKIKPYKQSCAVVFEAMILLFLYLNKKEVFIDKCSANKSKLFHLPYVQKAMKSVKNNTRNVIKIKCNLYLVLFISKI